MIGNTDVDAITLLPVNNASKDSHLFNLRHKMIKRIKHLWKQPRSVVGLWVWQVSKLLPATLPPSSCLPKRTVSSGRFLSLN